jgi:predicted enzyme related to lactoylglutathione lyase
MVAQAACMLKSSTQFQHTGEQMMRSVIDWFEIPASDFDRAVKFYETVLGVQLHHEVADDIMSAVFPYEGEAASGAVVLNPHFQPSTQGAVVYLGTNGDLDGALKRVVAAGGQVIMPKTSVGDPGYIALVIDTEGNKIGLHQEK